MVASAWDHMSEQSGVPALGQNPLFSQFVKALQKSVLSHTAGQIPRSVSKLPIQWMAMVMLPRRLPVIVSRSENLGKSWNAIDIL